MCLAALHRRAYRQTDVRNCCFLRRDCTYTGRNLPAFRRNPSSPSSEQKSGRRFLGKMKRSFPVTCHAATKEGGSRGITLLILNLSARWGARGQRHAPTALHAGKSHGTHFTEDTPGNVWMGTEKIKSHAPKGARTPNPPAHSDTLYWLRYLTKLTPWSRVLLEKLTGRQLVKKFPAFYGTRRFITAFTRARHLSLS
jgi:hypothetical protein